MHAGSIDNPDSGAGKVYAVLKARSGQWVGGWDLQQSAVTTAVSTRVSEVRLQLDANPGRGETVEVKQEGRKFFYRLTASKGQLELIA